MNQDYVDTARLLLAVAPAVFRPPQHPRDIFDVLKMIERFGWQPSFVDCFVAYLAGHNRPVHEVLFPKQLPLEPAFTNEFAGMTRDATRFSAQHDELASKFKNLS